MVECNGQVNNRRASAKLSPPGGSRYLVKFILGRTIFLLYFPVFEMSTVYTF